MCDHIMIIDKGRLIASDTPENLELQMAGKAGMELLIRGEKEQILRILEAIPQAADVSLEESGEEGISRISFCISGKEDEDGTDIRETIFFAFADQRLPILSMKATKVSLEEVFLELTAEAETDSKEADGEETGSKDTDSGKTDSEVTNSEETYREMTGRGLSGEDFDSDDRKEYVQDEVFKKEAGDREGDKE